LASKRVIHELSPTELFKRVVQRAAESCDAAHARADAAFAQRVKEACLECFAGEEEVTANGVPHDNSSANVGSPAEPVTA
jgi:hypothetical protein